MLIVWGGLPPHLDEPSGLLVSVACSWCGWWALTQWCRGSKTSRWVVIASLPVCGLMLGSAWLLSTLAGFPGVTALLYLVHEPLSAWKMSASEASSMIPWLGLGLGVGWSAVMYVATRDEHASGGTSRLLYALVLLVVCGLSAAMPESEPFRSAPYVSDVRLVNGIGQTAQRLLTQETQLPVVPARQPVDPRDVPSPSHDVLIVLAESLRPDHLPAYGYKEHATSPALDALLKERAEHTLVFTRAYANSSYTVFALITLFTGLSIAQPVDRLSEWPLIWHYARALGLHTFFISTQELRWSNVFEFLFRADPPDTLISAADEIHPLVNDLGIDDRFTAEDAASQIRALSPERHFFGIIQTNSTHFPFLPSPDAPWEIDDVTSRYDAAVRLTDDVLGAAIDALRATGRLEETLIIVLSDHAEYIHRDPDQGASPQGRLRPSSCHPTITHIPMIVHIPDSLKLKLDPAQLRQNISRVVSTLDVLPTVLHSWGLEPSHALDGQSMLSPVAAQRQVTCLSPNSAYPSDFLGFSITSKDHIFYDRQDFAHTEHFSSEDHDAHTAWGEGAPLTQEQRAIFKAYVDHEPTLLPIHDVITRKRR